MSTNVFVAVGPSPNPQAVVEKRNKWAEYDAAKYLWLKRNPDASSEEVGAAFRKIANDLGL